MGVVYEYLMFNGANSRDFNVWISGSGTFDAPARDVTSESVPGRNGDLHIDNGRFNNVKITYPAFITKDFQHNFSAFKAFLLSQRGYKRLEDSYNPGYYRMASYQDGITPSMTALNRAGKFDISFDCMPQRFLIDGEKVKIFSAAGSLKNPTLYDALPLIRAYGTGSLTINGTTIQISAASGYTDIDCDMQEAYKGSTSCNANIILTDGAFPVLSPGLNSISFTGLTQLDITPRWWTI